MPVVGADKHKARLRNLIENTGKAVLQALYVTGQKIELTAEKSITEGSVSGKNHVPSKPGEPPNADTRRLDTNIETSIAAKTPPTVHVTSHAPYSTFLEWGTSRMAPRPYMRPALAKHKTDAVSATVTAVSSTAAGKKPRSTPPPKG